MGDISASQHFCPETTSETFQDTSTECAICLFSLDNEEQEVITLSCGHKWHLRCVQEQLEHAQPSPARRLLFTGCRCAKCAMFCDHPKLQHLTVQTDSLRHQVDALIVEQLQVDAPQVWMKHQRQKQHLLQYQQHQDGRRDGDDSFRTLMDHGRRTYAFYLCGECQQPYFGGTVACADQEDEDLPPASRRCLTCAAPHQSICRQPLQHRGQLIWKCRYCCQPSQFICHGNVHFCSNCHERYGQRRQSGQRTTTLPPLEAIPCPGGQACPFPKSPFLDRHKNGPAFECEQAYQCGCCASADQAALASFSVAKSRNLLINPSGAMGLQGWKREGEPWGTQSWQVEPCALPLWLSDDETCVGAGDRCVSTNFVSSFSWCLMSQRVRLHTIVRNPSTVRLEVAAYYMARTDCRSVFQMSVVVSGFPPPPPQHGASVDNVGLGEGGALQPQASHSQQLVVLHRQSTPVLEAPADSWERVTMIVEPQAGAREVVICLRGKDSQFWRGHYGSKVTACSLKVLAETQQELENALHRSI